MRNLMIVFFFLTALGFTFGQTSGVVNYIWSDPDGMYYESKLKFKPNEAVFISRVKGGKTTRSIDGVWTYTQGRIMYDWYLDA